MRFFEELKRRNVLRMAGLYLVGAWFVVQVAGTLLPAFDFPSWALRVAIGVLAIGFVPAMVFSWVFELTPGGLKREKDVERGESIMPHTGRMLDRTIMVALALALGYFAFDKFVLAPRRDAVEQQQTTEKLAEARKQGGVDALVQSNGDRSIAVLPFLNMSSDPAQEFFSEGIAEEILNQLAQFPDLMVAARTSAFQFNGKNLDVADIGRKLNVAHVLEGSVRKQGTRLRITAQLIKTTTGFHLWSQTFERDAGDVFKVQDEISTAIAKALQAKLSGRPASPALPKIADPTAYDDYLQARTLVARRLGDSITQGIVAYDRAIARDPSYSAAHSGRALALMLAPLYTGSMTLPQAAALALTGSEQALLLDANNAEAYLVRAMVHSIRFEEVAARADFERALSLAPGNVEVLNFAGDNLESVANLRGAERMKRQVMALDPLSFVHPMDLAYILNMQGRFREALAMNERAIQLGGGRRAYGAMIGPYLRLGDIDKARAIVTSFCETEDSFCLIARVALLAAAGEQRELDLAKAKLEVSRPAWLADGVFPEDVAALYANYSIDIPKATAAALESLQGACYQATTPLHGGPQGARMPEEVSQDPEWLSVWNDPKLRETMIAYRANLAAFRKGE